MDNQQSRRVVTTRWYSGEHYCSRFHACCWIGRLSTHVHTIDYDSESWIRRCFNCCGYGTLTSKLAILSFPNNSKTASIVLAITTSDQAAHGLGNHIEALDDQDQDRVLKVSVNSQNRV